MKKEEKTQLLMEFRKDFSRVKKSFRETIKGTTVYGGYKM